MATRPQTIGYSLTDSPVGLAAWIYAMFQDVGGSHHEHGDAEALFSLDEMIDDVMLYWLPGTPAPRPRRCTGSPAGAVGRAPAPSRRR
ncbi:hypothetical protein [Microbacterium testaceum]|uniref:hypothetical protein n=1 Tax=Microbacterium testaceum TaxID=2033 RepID=UPI001D1725EF|nr:hypothetical protein [Microbacterium testaceum]MCC4250577.1 hypothetical protein [Microbacterium testaceum]